MLCLLIHGCLCHVWTALGLASQNLTSLWLAGAAIMCRWRSHPQHQKQTSFLTYHAASSLR